MKSMDELFEHEIKDLYSAEKQLVDALPDMVKAASDQKLKDAFAHHLEETRGHFDRIKQICQDLGINASRKKCKAMEGLIEECKSMIKEKGSNDVRDAGLIATAQRVEHYEISAYGTSHTYAKSLGHTRAAQLLQETLNEEKAADEKLNKLALNGINRSARKN